MKLHNKKGIVWVIGKIWMPRILCAMEYPLNEYHMENIGEFTRDNLEWWLGSNAGDFSEIIDFSATCGDIEIPWMNNDSQYIYCDCMYGGEDE